MDNVERAREHFEALDHLDGLVASYFVNPGECFIIARPNRHSGHRISSTVPAKEESSKILDYVGSLINTWSTDGLTIRVFEVLDDGEIC